MGSVVLGKIVVVISTTGEGALLRAAPVLGTPIPYWLTTCNAPLIETFLTPSCAGARLLIPNIDITSVCTRYINEP